jgi:hypothetical protein
VRAQACMCCCTTGTAATPGASWHQGERTRGR